jgi:hypothetical protein
MYIYESLTRKNAQIKAFFLEAAKTSLPVSEAF